MNMISTGAFLNEMDASNKQSTVAEKFAAVWEKKNAKAARAGGVSLMALSLAACGSSSSDSSSSSGGSTPATTPTAQTLTLTSGVDTVAGGSGDDTINAGLDSSGNQTLTALDNISGGAGTDTMNVVMKANATPASTGVENYVVSTSAAATLDMLGSTGVTSISNKASTNTLTVENISGDVALTLSSTDQGGTFNFDTAGAKAAQTVNVSSVTGGTLTVGTTGEVTLNSQGAANSVTLSSSATSLKVTGSEDLTLSGTTAQTTIDASGATGKFTVTSDNTKAVTITGSEGADTVTMTGSNVLTDTINLGGGNDKVTFTAALDDADKVDGGDGTDTLVGISADVRALTTTTDNDNISNFETVQISNQLNGNLDVNNIQKEGIDTVTLAHASAAAGAIISGGHTITGEAGSFTVNIGKSLADNDSTLGSTLVITDGADNKGTADSLTVNNTGVNSTTGKNIILTNDITSTGYENVTFNTGSGSGNAEQTMATLTVNADSATSATSLTLKGANAVDITTAVDTNSTAGITIDGSGLTAQSAGTTTMDLDTVAAGTGATITITGSEGDDIFGTSSAATNATLATTVNAGAGTDVIYTGTGADTVNGGAGNDTIDSGSGNDTIDGGAGNDTIYLDGTFTKDDTVVGGEGTDTLHLNNTDATTLNAYALGTINSMNAKNSGIEKVNFGTSLAQSIDMGRIDGVSTVELGNLAGDAGLTGLGATNEVIIRATTGQALNLALADATGTSDELNITLKESAVLAANTITANGIETINIFGTDDDNTSGNTDDANVNTMTLVSDKATTIVVTGKDGLNLTSTSATKITRFDASAVAGEDTLDDASETAVTYTSANTSSTAEVTILGGEGNDTLQGNNGADTISGGKGDDAITYTGGNDTITGGSGDDTVTMTGALFAANSASSNTSTFDGGTGTNTLTISDNGATIVDADFDGMTNFQNLTTADGSNSITLGAKADAAGITTITGGTGVDTIDISDTDFDNAVDLVGFDKGETITLATGTSQAATIVVKATSGANTASITNWLSGTDQIDLDKSDLTLTGSAGDNLENGNYYEGAAGSMVVGTAYDVIVLTGASYANINAAEDAVALRSTATNNALIIFHNSGNSRVEAFWDDNIGNDDAPADTIEVLAFADFDDSGDAGDIGGLFAIGDFNIIA